MWYLVGLIILLCAPGIYSEWTMRKWNTWRIDLQPDGKYELMYNYRGEWCSHGLWEYETAVNEMKRLCSRIPLRLPTRPI